MNNLTLQNDLHYNGSGYIDQANVSHQGSQSASLTSAIQYKDNNLLGTWIQQGQGDRHFYYNSAKRLTCSEYNGNVREYLEYDGSGRREHRTWAFYGSSACANVVANPSGALATSWFHKRSTYMWDGNQLVSEDAANCQNIGLPETSCPVVLTLNLPKDTALARRRRSGASQRRFATAARSARAKCAPINARG